MIRDEQGRKCCRSCNEWLTEDSFTVNSSSKDGLEKHCVQCRRNTKILDAYGLTPERYDAMLDAQNGGCAICGGVNAGGRSLAVDHDHGCCPGVKSCGGCVRALLCDCCNRMLGLAQDDPQRLRDAATYLEHRKR